MSLQVWLPLNGNLENKGLANVSVTNSGATIDTSGKIGKCYSFNGTNNYIYYNFPLTSTMTFSCWVNFRDSGNYHIIDARNASSDIGYQPLYGGTTYGIQIYTHNGKSNNYSASECGFTINTWYHLTAVIGPTYSELFINGVSKGKKALGYGDNSQGTQQIRIGTRCSGTNWFNGKINDVRVYDHCLSDKEIKEISKGLFLDYTFTNRIDYVQNIYDNAYIDLEFVDTRGIVVEADVDWQEGGYFVGSHNIASPYGQNGGYLDSGRSFWELGAGEVCPQNVSYGIQLNHKYHIKFSTVIGNRYLDVDGNRILTTSDTTPVCNLNVLMFTNQHSQQNSGKSTKVKIYHTKIWDSNNTLRRDLHPCIRNNKVGFYDSVSNTFFFSNVANEPLLGGIDDGTIYDCSGYGNNGNVTDLNSFSIVPCEINGQYALRRLGDNPQAYINTNIVPNFITNGTLILWYKKDSSAASYNSGNFLIATIRDGGTWLCATQNGLPFHSNASISNWYVDGVLNKSSLQSDTNWHMYCATGVNISSWGSLVFQNHGDDSWLWRGDIARLQFYATPLTAEEINDLYSTVVSIDNNGNLYCRELVEG